MRASTRSPALAHGYRIYPSPIVPVSTQNSFGDSPRDPTDKQIIRTAE